jgi:hypothetical protein
VITEKEFRVVDCLFTTRDYDEAFTFWKGAAATIVGHHSQDRLSVRLDRDSNSGEWTIYLQEYR